MEKIDENSMLYDLIHKPLVLWGFTYFISVLGIFCKYYFNLKDSFWAEIIIYFSFIICFTIMGIVESKSSNKILHDDKLNWESKKYLLDYNHDLYYNDKKFVYFKFYMIILFTFQIGLYGAFLDKITLIDFTNYILTTFGISIFSLHWLLYDSDGDKLIFNSMYGFLVNSILMLFISILKFNFGLFTKIFNIITGHINDFFILSLTIILLGATLSLVAFTYNMILKNESDVQNNMKIIGEKFFISTLFSMFFLFLTFILSLYCTYSNILSLGNINFIEPSLFIKVNFFVILLFLSIFTLTISLKYLLEGVISSLNNLPFKF